MSAAAGLAPLLCYATHIAKLRLKSGAFAISCRINT